ncbi:MAG: amidohydrolase family protein [Mycobacteriales bacterium]
MDDDLGLAVSRVHCGLALFGRIWPGGSNEPLENGVLLVDPAGLVARIGPAAQVEVPTLYRRLGSPGHWVGPGVLDAHVHLAFGGPDQELRGGIVGVRDLGAPLERALGWRTGPGTGAPYVAVAGPLLTAPGGYPASGWGADGFASFVGSPAAAVAEVRRLAAAGVDVVKLALEPAGGQRVPPPEVAAAVVRAAHEVGLAVVAHALSAAMVERALDAGVDELVHTPTERLSRELVDRLAAAPVRVVSTLETLCRDGDPGPALNAKELVAAGVRLVYGTDLGNAGTKPGVDPRELRRLAAAGLGPQGALTAATEGAAAAAGMAGPTGRLVAGARAAAVVLVGDPLVDPDHWREPVAVVGGDRLVAA